MERKFDPRGGAARLLAVVLALLVWQGASMALGNELLLASPLRTAQRLVELVPQSRFWLTVGASFLRIVGGFLSALLLGTLLAVCSSRFPLFETLLRPYMELVQSVPVAAFIVLALLWLSARNISFFIAFLMVLPVLYSAVLQGIHAADPQLLEMAKLYRVPFSRRVSGIYLHALRPSLLSGCRVALGLCWKSGVAAEVIGVSALSIGGRMYDAKVMVETAELFAWTAVVVALSVGFSYLFRMLLEGTLRRWEGV